MEVCVVDEGWVHSHECMWRGLVVRGDHACMRLKMEEEEHDDVMKRKKWV